MPGTISLTSHDLFINAEYLPASRLKIRHTPGNKVIDIRMIELVDNRGHYVLGKSRDALLIRTPNAEDTV